MLLIKVNYYVNFLSVIEFSVYAKNVQTYVLIVGLKLNDL